MKTDLLTELRFPTSRHRLFLLICKPNKVQECIDFLSANNINSLNVGLELSKFIDIIDDYSYLTIELIDYFKKLLDSTKSCIDKSNNIIAIYNFGILLEDTLELDASLLFKDFSKTNTLIIMCEFGEMNNEKLYWSNNKNNYIDLTNTNIKILEYEIQ